MGCNKEIGKAGGGGHDLSKIRRFEDLGMEEARGKALAAQQLWFRGYL